MVVGLVVVLFVVLVAAVADMFVLPERRKSAIGKRSKTLSC